MVDLGWIKVKNCPRCGSDSVNLNRDIRIDGEYIGCCICEKCKTLVGTKDSDVNLMYWNNIRRK